jgi:hypothetical protein
MGNELVHGTVRDGTGAPVAGAEVFAGVRRVADAQTPDACRDFGQPGSTQLLGVVRAVTDERGMYAAPAPEVEEGDRPNCLFVFAELRGTEPTGEERVMAAAEWQWLPLPSERVQVDLTLETSPPPGAGPRGRFATPDGEAAHLARTRVPGFAGLFLAGCTLVVNLTDPPRQEAAARTYVEQLLQERPLATGPQCPDPLPIEFRRVDYDFDQLVRWSLRAGILMSLEGATIHDIAENRNRIVFGYADEVGIRRAERALHTFGVPREAFVIEIQEPVRILPPPPA